MRFRVWKCTFDTVWHVGRVGGFVTRSFDSWPEAMTFADGQAAALAEQP